MVFLVKKEISSFQEIIRFETNFFSSVSDSEPEENLKNVQLISLVDFVLIHYDVV